MTRFVSSAVLVVCAMLSNAQSPEPVPRVLETLPGVKMAKAPTIDGKFESGEWPSEAHGSGFSDKDTGLASDEKGEFWIGYDDRHIYFAARAYTDPKRLVDDEYRSNVNLNGNDAFILAIDATASGQDFDLFTINPQGATNLRLSGGRAAKTEWIGDFESVGSKTADGWQIEAAIPWTLINRPTAGKHDFVFNVLWFRSNKSNTYEWVYTKENFVNFPRLTGVDVPNIAKERTLNLLPYGYVGWDKETGRITNAGLDLKTELTDNITLVGTANPDFRNVENAILSLDFSYFERLADESRPFFQEGARYRSFGMDSRLFASQRIGDFDAGLNAYGTMGKTTFGFLATSDFGNRTAVALNTGTRLNSVSSLSAAYVGNLQRGTENQAGRVAYDRRIGNWDAYVALDTTRDQIQGGGHRFTAGMYRFNDGTQAIIDYTEASPNFFPRIGFAPEVDFRSVYVQYGREFQPYGKIIRDYSLEINGSYADRYHGGEYRRNVSASAWVSFANRVGLSVESTFERFEGSNDRLVELDLRYPVGDPYRNVGASYSEGEFGGEHYRNVSVSARYRPVKRCQLNLSSQWTEFTDTNRQTILSANYDIGKFEAIGGRLVRRDSDWNWYLSYRLSGKRGNEFFLILGDPNANEFRKSIVLKAVIPVTVRF